MISAALPNNAMKLKSQSLENNHVIILAAREITNQVQAFKSFRIYGELRLVLDHVAHSAVGENQRTNKHCTGESEFIVRKTMKFYIYICKITEDF